MRMWLIRAPFQKFMNTSKVLSTVKKPLLLTTWHKFVASIMLDKAVNNLLAYLTVLLNDQSQIVFG